MKLYTCYYYITDNLSGLRSENNLLILLCTDGMECYDCGYMIVGGGNPEAVGDKPFCNDFVDMEEIQTLDIGGEKEKERDGNELRKQ